jgi:hypothetical protein
MMSLDAVSRGLKAAGGVFSLSAAAVLLLLAPSASAQVDFKTLPCTIISDVAGVVYIVGPTLILIMFVYGAIKYALAADNPSGRNNGKTICIQAMVAGILWGLWTVISTLLSGYITWWGTCWGGATP